ncbi:MAG TPA: KEOPS complex subunit Cgi121 [Methanomicrobiales archaeon]|nr:KEOPS complex subunit Cgi121 [Methanomicrobiales archaeon]
MTTEPFEIRTAIFRVDDCSAFLGRLRAIGRARGTHIVCFNADLMAGRAHAEAAVRRAFRAVAAGTVISDSFEMEALLFASGNRQCTIAQQFGIHEGENRAYVCLCPPVEAAWRDLSVFILFVDRDWETLSGEKEARLREIFGITEAELGAAGAARLQDLVLERVALLEVYR